MSVFLKKTHFIKELGVAADRQKRSAFAERAEDVCVLP